MVFKDSGPARGNNKAKVSMQNDPGTAEAQGAQSANPAVVGQGLAH